MKRTDATSFVHGRWRDWFLLQIGEHHTAPNFAAMIQFLQILCCWSPCACRSVGTSSSFEFQGYMSGGDVLFSLQATIHDEYAFLLFGTCRRRVRASLLRFLRFNGQEPPGLSSVLALLDLQLILLPHRHLSTRLLVEPLALRLARLREALEESDCTLRHNHHVSSAVLGIKLGKPIPQDGSCNHCVVTFYFF